MVSFAERYTEDDAILKWMPTVKGVSQFELKLHVRTHVHIQIDFILICKPTFREINGRIPPSLKSAPKIQS